MTYTFNISLSEAKRQNLGSLSSELYISFRTSSTKIHVETSRELSAEEQATLQTSIEGITDVVVYDPETLIAWAIVEYPSFIGTVHEYVLSTFAGNPSKYKNFMLQRASIIDSGTGNTIFTDVANALIAKAIELGANI